MLDTSIAVLSREIADIRHQIRSLELEANIFEAYGTNAIADARIEQLVQHLQGRSLIKRRFVYCGLIISVSGMLEQYLDSLISEFVQTVSRISFCSDDVPFAIVANHLDLSLEYLGAVARDSYRGDDSVGEIISRLHSSHCTKDSFVFNERAFSYRRANYRSDLVTQVFSRIGVIGILQRIYDSNAFSQYIQTQRDADNSQIFDRGSVFKRLDDLAERRNDVAHGNVNQILNHDLIVPYIDFVEAFGLSVHDVLVEELFRVLSARPIVFHQPFQVINNSIVCIQKVNYSISVGDYACPISKP